MQISAYFYIDNASFEYLKHKEKKMYYKTIVSKELVKTQIFKLQICEGCSRCYNNMKEYFITCKLLKLGTNRMKITG